jgi:hypothetical protein
MGTMVALGTVAIIGYLFYLLFIKGIVWPILLFAFGVYGGSRLIERFIASSKAVLVELSIGDGHYYFSWSICVAALISLLGIGYFMKDDK